jgi:hypothetical protein
MGVPPPDLLLANRRGLPGSHPGSGPRGSADYFEVEDEDADDGVAAELWDCVVEGREADFVSLAGTVMPHGTDHAAVYTEARRRLRVFP